jgi:prevent-host-death family protein
MMPGDKGMNVPIVDAKHRLGALIEDVERGHEITITRRGVAVARLVPAHPAFDRDAARRAAEGLIEASKGARLNGLRIKDLVNDGRP